MQAIINETSRMDKKWFTDTVVETVSAFGRTNTEVTPQIIADAVVKCLKSEGEDAYITPVDISKIKEGLRRPSDQLEVRYYDFDLDEQVPVIRIGVDAKNNIHVADVPKANAYPQSIRVVS